MSRLKSIVSTILLLLEGGVPVGEVVGEYMNRLLSTLCNCLPSALPLFRKERNQNFKPD